jgi:hypothetical protein
MEDYAVESIAHQLFFAEHFNQLWLSDATMPLPVHHYEVPKIEY